MLEENSVLLPLRSLHLRPPMADSLAYSLQEPLSSYRKFYIAGSYAVRSERKAPAITNELLRSKFDAADLNAVFQRDLYISCVIRNSRSF